MHALRKGGLRYHGVNRAAENEERATKNGQRGIGCELCEDDHDANC